MQKASSPTRPATTAEQVEQHMMRATTCTGCSTGGARRDEAPCAKAVPVRLEVNRDDGDAAGPGLPQTAKVDILMLREGVPKASGGCVQAKLAKLARDEPGTAQTIRSAPAKSISARPW